MKNFLQNLLIFFALALCGLIAFQWVRETHLRKQVQDLNDAIHDKAQAVQDLQGSLHRDESEIQRLDGIKNQLTATLKSNQFDIARLNKDVEKAAAENEKNLKQIDVFKGALQTANDNIKKQNEDIQKQNEEMKALAKERNDVVVKFNEMASNYNRLATDWNKVQGDLAKAATNAPPKR